MPLLESTKQLYIVENVFVELASLPS